MTRCLDTVVDHYLIAALWTEGDGELDGFSICQIDPASRAQVKKDIEDFLAKVTAQGIDTSSWNDEQLGHDFWLTRNGHGAGFWDRGHEPAGRQLSDICRAFPARNAVIADAGAHLHRMTRGHICIE